MPMWKPLLPIWKLAAKRQVSRLKNFDHLASFKPNLTDASKKSVTVRLGLNSYMSVMAAAFCIYGLSLHTLSAGEHRRNDIPLFS